MTPDDCVPTGSYWDRHQNCAWPSTTCPACLTKYSYHSCEGHHEYCDECREAIYKGGDSARKRILSKAIIKKKVHVCKTCKAHESYKNEDEEGWCPVLKEITKETDGCNRWKQKPGVFASGKKKKTARAQ